MKLHKDIFIIIVIGYSLLLTSPSSTALSPQLPPLPADLVFGGYTTVTDPLDGLQQDHAALILINHETLKLTELYHSSDSTIAPLAWSPQGDLLVFVTIKSTDGWDEGEPMNLCVVTTTGTLQTCFEEKLTYFPEMLRYTATWSADGSKVYFVTLKNQRWQLVEADAFTGKTLRTIYQREFVEEKWWTNWPTRWTSDLKIVGLEIGNPRTAGILVHMDTSEETDIKEILKPYIDETMEREHPDSIYVCPDFSPKDTFLTALISTAYDDIERTNQLIVFDTTGKTTLVLEESNVLASCPTWTPDESGFYFYRDSTRGHDWGRKLFFYSFNNNSLSEWGDSYGRGTTPVAVSPDGTHIAFRAPYESALIVLYPDRVMRKVSAYYGPVMLGISLWRPVVGDS